MALLKACLLSLGIAVGAYIGDSVRPYIGVFLTFSIAVGVYLLAVAFWKPRAE